MHVDTSLEGGHVALDDIVNFVWELRFDLFLELTQQEGAEHLVETTDDQNSLFLIQLHLKKYELSTLIYSAKKFINVNSV